MCVGNWEDWSIEGYVASASKSKWLRIQAGDHLTPFYSEESLALQKRFFDHFLTGENNGWERESPVRVQIRRPDGTFWREETSWLLPGTQWQRFYLDAVDGGMGVEKNSASAAERSYEALGEGLTFTSAPFMDEVEFTGPVMLRLWVRSTTADMDIFATLRLIDPDGRDVTFTGNTDPRVPLGQGFLRVSHRALDPSKSTEYRPYHAHVATEPMTPGQLYEVKVEFIYPTSIVVPEGYRLALTIQGKDWQPPVHTVQSKDYELPQFREPRIVLRCTS